MESVPTEYQQQLTELAKELVTPDRFARPVMAEVVELKPVEDIIA